jgi:predicted regulator of Ras-like GTPase activity (Roadblock/LC7/MglB family)
MVDDIKAMTAELARDPTSLVFLNLGEALRARGQSEPAARIAASGVVRHPDLPSAHDLYARVLVDLGDFERAYHEWTVVLELDQRHFGAHKGLGFLCYRWGDLDGAVDHLELALAADPRDQSVVHALQRVREGTAELAAPPEPAEEPAAQRKEGKEAEEGGKEPAVEPVVAADASPWAALEGGGGRGVMLADERGLLLSGGLEGADLGEVGEEVAAYLAGAAQEAGRAARLLDFGAWRSMLVEGEGLNLLVTPPTDDTVLLLIRGHTVPQGRLRVLAERASRSARTWLEEQQP